MKAFIFDTETTGLLKPDNTPLDQQPKIIEFYGVVIDTDDFSIIEEFETFIYPGELITDEITRITGIKNSDIRNAPNFEEVANQISELINMADLSVAHNLAFDNGMISNEFKRIDWNVPCTKNNLCTVEAWKAKYGNRISLGALYNKLFKASVKAHRAKSDVFALVRVFHELIEMGVIDLDIYSD